MENVSVVLLPARCENEKCGYTQIAHNSCRNRHCPKCQGAAAREWLAEREAELLLVKPQCCPDPPRKVTRDVDEGARHTARAPMGTPEFDRPMPGAWYVRPAITFEIRLPLS